MEYDFSKEAGRPEEVQYDFSTLPYEVQFNYLLYLPVTDIANYCATSPHATNICIDDVFWKAKMDHDFPGISQYKPKDITYQQQFLDTVQVNHQIIKYLNPKRNRPMPIKHTFINSLVQRGRLDLLLVMEAQGYVPDEHGMDFAAENGSIDILEWLETKNVRPTISTANAAASEGQIKVLEWLKERNILPGVVGADSAAYHGYINVLNWLGQWGIYPSRALSNRTAIINQPEVMAWLASRGIHY